MAEIGWETWGVGFSSPPWPIPGYDSDRASQNVQFFYENKSKRSIFQKNPFFNTFSTVFWVKHQVKHVPVFYFLMNFHKMEKIECRERLSKIDGKRWKSCLKMIRRQNFAIFVGFLAYITWKVSDSFSFWCLHSTVGDNS